MKNKSYPVLLLFVVLFPIITIAQEIPVSADEILKTACKDAVGSKKNVFILFHASWCGWCHKMDTAMSDPSIRNYFTDNYVIRHIVVYEQGGKQHLNNPGAVAMLEKYKGNDHGIPYWIIFDQNGNWMADSKLRPANGGMDTGENTGCPANAQEVEHFITVLKKTSPLQATQLAAIEKRFRKNAEN